MTGLTFEHSEDWIEKLTVPSYELSPSERAAIAVHTLSCPDCSRFLADRAQLEEFIDAWPEKPTQDLPAPDFPKGLSPRLKKLWKEEDAYSKTAELEHRIRELME
jgi:hypothetical protein